MNAVNGVEVGKVGVLTSMEYMSCRYALPVPALVDMFMPLPVFSLSLSLLYEEGYPNYAVLYVLPNAYVLVGIPISLLISLLISLYVLYVLYVLYLWSYASLVLNALVLVVGAEVLVMLVLMAPKPVVFVNAVLVVVLDNGALLYDIVFSDVPYDATLPILLVLILILVLVLALVLEYGWVVAAPNAVVV